ncbi:N-acylneuraminate cytidylyltransferase [Neolewinella xylanilytica]|uniref:N-acylneuraminate cytidylyltransferase n=1 Tax=Neolewinella xylanilytica TaxID=1514080 RepID=A0A2S6I923_9BACT|nr:pseudaminic acid cytidylyltransferase [Neolewinella xylanilytica]PPK87982.1 N-acylneuraminate cytidylyltransferase [Neolewinella xylanilytica]
MRRLAIIPARGGSKRIPRKNIRPFLDKPIIGYSIAAALDCQLFDEVMVSTDDEEIAQAARSLGAKVPFSRSREASSDTATTYTVIEEVLGKYEDQGIVFDEVCCIYATSPFITPDLLRCALRMLQEKAFDSVFPVIRYSFPIQRGLTVDDSGKMTLLAPEHLDTRSQDLPPTYHDAGMFYWFRPEPIVTAGRLWTSNSGCLPIDEMEAQDIDTETDWKLAELKYQLLRNG